LIKFASIFLLLSIKHDVTPFCWH